MLQPDRNRRLVICGVAAVAQTLAVKHSQKVPDHERDTARHLLRERSPERVERITVTVYRLRKLPTMFCKERGVIPNHKVFHAKRSCNAPGKLDFPEIPRSIGQRSELHPTGKEAGKPP